MSKASDRSKAAVSQKMGMHMKAFQKFGREYTMATRQQRKAMRAKLGKEN